MGGSGTRSSLLCLLHIRPYSTLALYTCCFLLVRLVSGDLAGKVAGLFARPPRGGPGLIELATTVGFCGGIELLWAMWLRSGIELLWANPKEAEGTSQFAQSSVSALECVCVCMCV
jgi:hypothetical protein